MRTPSSEKIKKIASMSRKFDPALERDIHDLICTVKKGLNSAASPIESDL